MPKARGPKAGMYRLSRCVGPPGGMPQKARRARSSLRALPAGSSRASRVCGFRGLAPDLFAADRKAGIAYRDAIAAGKFAPDLFHDSANYFQNRNVTAIVIEVPTRSIGDPAATVRAWVTVSLYGHAPEVQVSRWGLPLITHIFITDEAVKDDYNRSLPSADVPRFSRIVSDALRPTPSWRARPTTRPPTHSVWWSACSRPLCLMSSVRRPRSVSQASMAAR